MAPFFCGGLTSFTSLKRYAKPGGSCAIVGVGGMGHLAVQFANKLGMHVTAFTTKVELKESIASLGATSIENTVDAETLSKN
jgi:alcohol/geraniol dehydrogenase (NADP+)